MPSPTKARISKSNARRSRIRRIRGRRKRQSDSPQIHPLLQLQQTLGNQAVGRLIQAKLKVGEPGDKFEQEADRVAEQVASGSESLTSRGAPVSGNAHGPLLQRVAETEDDKRVLQGPHEAFEGPLEEEMPVIRRMPQAEEDDEVAMGQMPMAEEDEALQKMPIAGEEKSEEEEAVPSLQTQSIANATPSVNPTVTRNIANLSGGGQPLPKPVRSYFEPRFGADFSPVRLHTDSLAASTARAVQARAFTADRNIVFSAGEYSPTTTSGRMLLAHELTHVVQQARAISGFGPARHSPSDNVIQRKTDKQPRINYARARRRNRRFARRLKWGARLVKLKPAWALLWSAANYDSFADTVAAFQVAQGFKGLQVNGVLDSRTWDRMRPVGEVIAKQKVSWKKSNLVCTFAAKERLVKGYRRATGKRLIPKAEGKTINYILQSFNLGKVDEKYRGTGAAGALVKLGQGEFVSESDIWDKKSLRPGAALQVWGSKKAFEQLQKGKNVSPHGTAAIFVKYLGKNKMRVRHFGQIEAWSKTHYQVWVGANLRAR